METHKKFTIRIPPELDARIRSYRKAVGVTANFFGCQALEQALDRAGVPRRPHRARKPAEAS